MSKGPLDGIKVIDAATLLAGPLAAMIMGDFGAEVLKIEHPKKGDGMRNYPPSKNGVPLWWKMIGRNKRAITLYLGSAEGQAVFRKLARTTDIIVENFRPGTLERWGLGYEQLSAENPGLILVRVTAFGQHGPYSKRPGFGTIAEAMSGFASMTGEPDGPPTLPPFGLADGIVGIAAALAASMAINARHKTGLGQVVDIALIEPILAVLGAQSIVYDQTGEIPQRTGNLTPRVAPRNAYQTADGNWVAMSGASTTVAERVMNLVGWPEATKQPWFATAAGRVEHQAEIDEKVSAWIARRPMKEVLQAFEKAEAAIGQIYTIADIFTDPQYKALDTITTVKDDELGMVRMLNVMFRMSRNQGSIRSTGRSLGADNEQVYKREVGITDAEFNALKEKGVI